MNKVYAILLWFALLFCHNGLLAQNGGVIVTGKVYAEDEPEGFIGATVIEQDKNGRIYSSALTDFNGNFSLKIKNPNNSLNFSFVGYKKLTVSIGEQTQIRCKLESQNVMKEVTVKSLQTRGRRRFGHTGTGIFRSHAEVQYESYRRGVCGFHRRCLARAYCRTGHRGELRRLGQWFRDAYPGYHLSIPIRNL